MLLKDCSMQALETLSRLREINVACAKDVLIQLFVRRAYMKRFVGRVTYIKNSYPDEMQCWIVSDNGKLIVGSKLVNFSFVEAERDYWVLQVDHKESNKRFFLTSLKTQACGYHRVTMPNVWWITRFHGWNVEKQDKILVLRVHTENYLT